MIWGSLPNDNWYLQIIRIDMKLANEDVSMLAFTSEQITAPFLLPEMVIFLCLSILPVCIMTQNFGS